MDNQEMNNNVNQDANQDVNQGASLDVNQDVSLDVNQGVAPDMAITPKKSKKGLIIGIVAGIVVLSTAIFGYGMLNNNISNVNDLTKAMGKTAMKYDSEQKSMVANNPVLSNLAAINNEKSSQKIYVDGFFEMEMEFVHSKADKRFDIAVAVPDAMNSRGELYLHDQDILIGFADHPFIASKTDTIEADILSLMGGDAYTAEQLRTVFGSLEFSYDGLFTASGEEEALAKMGKVYSSVGKKLLDMGKFSVKDSTEAYDDGNKSINRKIQMVTLEYDGATLIKWLKEDLILALESDEEFRRIMEQTQILNGVPGNMSGNYDNMIDDLKMQIDDLEQMGVLENIEMRLGFDIYNGYIIRYKVEANEKESDGFEATLAIQGEENLLDDIEVIIATTGDYGYEVANISAKGNHIGKGAFTSKIAGEIDGDDIKLDIAWDLQKKEDNVKISGTNQYGESLNFEMTLAAEGSGVMAMCDIEGTKIGYKMEIINELPALPTATRPLGLMTLEDLMEMYGDVANVG